MRVDTDDMQADAEMDDDDSDISLDSADEEELPEHLKSSAKVSTNCFSQWSKYKFRILYTVDNPLMTQFGHTVSDTLFTAQNCLT